MNFGAGVAILAHREEFEIEHEKVVTLTAQIADQGKVVATFHGDIAKSLERAIEFGELRKFTARDYCNGLTTTKNLIDQINAEIQKLGKLQSVCLAVLVGAPGRAPGLYEIHYQRTIGRSARRPHISSSLTNPMAMRLTFVASNCRRRDSRGSI
jgi:hypothetical protein